MGKSNLQKLLNIGKATEKYLNTINIYDKDDFLSRDPYKVFDQLLEKNPTLPKPFLATLVGAKENVAWHLIYSDVVKEYEKSHPNHEWVEYRK